MRVNWSERVTAAAQAIVSRADRVLLQPVREVFARRRPAPRPLIARRTTVKDTVLQTNGSGTAERGSVLCLLPHALCLTWDEKAGPSVAGVQLSCEQPEGPQGKAVL